MSHSHGVASYLRKTLVHHWLLFVLHARPMLKFNMAIIHSLHTRDVRRRRRTILRLFSLRCPWIILYSSLLYSEGRIFER